MLCPFCNEEIKDGAKKCKHCGEFLDGSNKKEETKVVEKEVVYVEQKKKKKIGCFGRGIIILLVLYFIGYGVDKSIDNHVNGGTSNGGNTVVEHYIGGEDTRGIVEKGFGIYPQEIEESTTLKSNNMFEGNLVAGNMSKYLVVGFGVDNEQGAEMTLNTAMFPNIYDSQGRSYSTIRCGMGCSFYVNNRPAMLTLKPGIPQLVQLVYEVPRDSGGYYFKRKIKGVEHIVYMYEAPVVQETVNESGTLE